MKGFLNFFARWVVPVLGLLALSLIIWFLGPLLRLCMCICGRCI